MATFTLNNIKKNSIYCQLKRYSYSETYLELSKKFLIENGPKYTSVTYKDDSAITPWTQDVN